jgi:integrase
MKVSVRPYHDTNKPKLKWQVAVNTSEGRTRCFFETKAAADVFARQKRIEGEEIGNRALELDSDTRLAALKASKALKPFGKSIGDAVAHYIQYLHDSERSIIIDEAAEEFLAFKGAKGKSARYLLDLRSRLNAFRKAFGTRKVTEVTPKITEDWLARLDVGNVSRNNYRRVLSVFFGFCVKQGRCRDNPMQRVDVADVAVTDTEIFTPADMALMLSEAEGDILAYLAIGGFAGLRNAEIKRLQWEDIKRDVGEIDLSARITKTAQSRAVTILPVLTHYLEPFAFEHGSVCKPNFDQRMQNFRERMEKPVEGVRRAVAWQHNGLRHSFATYHYRLNDAGQTAKQLGHNGTNLLFKNYRKNRVSDADARAWFNLHLKAGSEVEFAEVAK